MSYETNIGDINLYGRLNSVTIDGIIAKAEQISIKIPFLENEKDYSILSEYIHSHMQFRDAEYIYKYISAENNTIPAMFMATSSAPQYKLERGHFYYYSGTQNQLEDLTPEGGSGGGSGASSIPVLYINTTFKDEYLVGETININYSWSASGTATGYGRVYGKIYGAPDGYTLNQRELPSNMVQSGGDRTWTIKGLPRGSYTIEMYVVDSANNQSYPRFKQDIVVGGLEVKSDFDTESYYPAGKELIVPFEVLTGEEKVYKVFATWDDEEPWEITEDFVVIPAEKMTDTIHELKIQAKTYIMVDGIETVSKESNILYLNIISAITGKVYITAQSNSAQSGTDPSRCEIEANQQVRFTVNIIEIDGEKYDLNYYLAPCDESFENQNGEAELLKSLVVTAGTNTTTFIFEKAGNYFLIAEAISKKSKERAECKFKCFIKDSELKTLEPISDKSLMLWLDASGKTNSDADLKWYDKSNNDVPVKLHNFNYNTNGWVTNEDGTSKNYLLINSRSYVEIDLEPFYKSDKFNVDKDGLTFDIEFETRDISNTEARVVSCFSDSGGLFVNTDTARLASLISPTEVTYVDVKDETGKVVTTKKVGPFEINFRQDIKTRLTFCINKIFQTADKSISLMCIYINGILAGLQELSNGDIFAANKGQKIYLGCNPKKDTVNEFENFGEAKIYNVRVYNRALNMTEVLTNYIADIKDPVLKDSKIRSNKLGSASNDTSLQLPEMTFNMYETDFKNIEKDTKRKCTVQYQTPAGADKFIDSFGLIQYQGTSTMAYAVKNLRITFYDKRNTSKVPEHIENKESALFNNLGDYGKKQKYDIGNGIGETRFTLKAD